MKTEARPTMVAYVAREYLKTLAGVDLFRKSEFAKKMAPILLLLGHGLVKIFARTLMMSTEAEG